MNSLKLKQMKNKTNLMITLSLGIILITNSSCQKEIYGCKDSNAVNFNKKANTDDDIWKYFNGFVTVPLTNDSVHTIQQINIDGANCGTQDPWIL